jgi:hypothetical protein
MGQFVAGLLRGWWCLPGQEALPRPSLLGDEKHRMHLG